MPLIFSEKKTSLLVPSTTLWCFQGLEKGCAGNEWVKYSSMLFISFSKAIFGESSSSSFSVLSSEPLKANISFGTNGVNLSETCSFLLLVRSFNSVNSFIFDIVWTRLSISFMSLFYFAHPPYSLLHLLNNISLSWCRFYYTFLRCVIKTTYLILCAYHCVHSINLRW